ncbi:MAG TPA: cytochrome P450 [Actinocrinis sp.]|uniref:cytochrome P450 n=1 Tax=Actinocrinis sp. TaxID=1920516 RepID=UPI002DDCE2D3|nr:cytochrome P450 [Actinocrinis sp.]HEV3172883.1 cytochrome P450 [Actinocrinis sp.]
MTTPTARVGRRPPVGFPLGAAVTLAELEGDPHPVSARLRAQEPVSWLPVLDGWLVTGYDLALDVMRDARTFTVDDPRFSTARVIGPSMLSLDGPEHARHRGPFVEPFYPAKVEERFAAFVQEETERLLSALRPRGAADLRAEFAGPLAVAVVARALGISGADAATVLAWYAAIVGAVSDITAGQPPRPAAAAAFAELGETVHASIAPRDGDAASLLADAAAHSTLTPSEIVSNAAVLMFGGIETTDAMIANVVYHLLPDPEQLALVRADPDLAGDAVEESLRLEPAASVVDRYATRDVSIGGADIRAGELVRVSLAAANRDPAVFDEPDRFDLRRPNSRKQLAFARGPHFCPGAHLARMEARDAVSALIAGLPGLRMDPAQGLADGPRGLVFRKPQTLRVVWDA